MKRLLPLLPFLALVGVLVLPVAPARAKSAEWTAAYKRFKSDFKTSKPIKTRRQAVKALAKSGDPRALGELLKAVKVQTRHAIKMKKEWKAEEEAWQEKTRRLEEVIEKKGDSAHGGGISVTAEEDEWFSLLQESKNRMPKYRTEKARIEGVYERALEEDDFTFYMFRKMSTLLNELPAEERSKTLKKFISSAKGAKKEMPRFFIHGLAYTQGDAATQALIDLAQSKDNGTRILALEALGRQNTERGMLFLMAQLALPEWPLRAATIKGLSFYHDPRVVQALLDGSKEETGSLQRKYFAALARVVQESIPGTPEAWASFWKSNEEDLVKQWKERYPFGEPYMGEVPDIPIDTSLGSTSFYGIQTNSKHIIFIVDVSGSMGNESKKNAQGDLKIDVARRELKKAIQSLSASDEDERGAASFNIVLFGTLITVYKPGKMITATLSHKKKALAWIEENVQPQKGFAHIMTNIFDALEAAFNVISDKKDSKNMERGADTIFLMTDGMANRGRFFARRNVFLREVNRLNEKRKLTIHTIGVGEHDRQLLGSIAAANDGQYLAR
ncbi:MAG: HEAT repeat domain-containing protein [Planctomycetota bacterium]